uniref:EGF-like domain-containing protein n=1 Tax=Trichuris muris TaxID=70415 RepID=A0A5S6PYS0_TRIMR
MRFQGFLLALLICRSSAVAPYRRHAREGETDSGVGKSPSICPPGFTGNECTTEIEKCPDYPCEQGAICHSIGSYKRCVCPTGRAGQYCEKAASQCESDFICLNGAPAYKGPYCETSVTLGKCTNSSCGNGHCMQHSEDVFGCLCDPGYEGIMCEKSINECQSSPCKNGAECTDLINDYVCKCTKGFKGRNCQIPACKPGYCVFGTCRELPNGFTCDCQKGFTGKRCTEAITDPGKEAMVAQKSQGLEWNSTGGILILVFGSFVVTGVLLLFIWTVAFRGRYRKQDDNWLSTDLNRNEPPDEQGKILGESFDSKGSTNAGEDHEQSSMPSSGTLSKYAQFLGQWFSRVRGSNVDRAAMSEGNPDRRGESKFVRAQIF